MANKSVVPVTEYAVFKATLYGRNIARQYVAKSIVIRAQVLQEVSGGFILGNSVLKAHSAAQYFDTGIVSFFKGDDILWIDPNDSIPDRRMGDITLVDKPPSEHSMTMKRAYNMALGHEPHEDQDIDERHVVPLITEQSLVAANPKAYLERRQTEHGPSPIVEAAVMTLLLDSKDIREKVDTTSVTVITNGVEGSTFPKTVTGIVAQSAIPRGALPSLQPQEPAPCDELTALKLLQKTLQEDLQNDDRYTTVHLGTEPVKAGHSEDK